MRRRGVLAGMAGLAVAGRLAAQVSGKSLAVVGAGMAGLAAARALMDLGADVTVYEARARIGGRIHTSNLWPDIPCDLGASWIHGLRGNPISALARAAGAGLVKTSYDSAASFLRGAQADSAIDAWDWISAAQDSGADISLQDAITALPDYAKLSAGQRRDLRAALHREIEHEYGGDWGQISALWLDAGRAFRGGDALFPRGYGQIVDHVAKGLAIQTGAQVTHITARAGGVEVRFAGEQSIRADAAVVTLPLGVLQAGDVVFDPPLAPERQGAIAALGMGLYNKVFLRFDTDLDLPAVDWMENLDASDLRFSEWVNLAHVLDAPALLGFNAADTAREVEALDDATTLAAATDALRAMLGSAAPAPVDAQITRWGRDGFARGSYSFHAIGAKEGARADLFGADWDGRIAFAGEAASADYPSTVHGAWLSGLQAVETLQL